MSVTEKKNNQPSIQPKPAPKITPPKPTGSKSPSPKLQGLLHQGQQQGQQIKSMTKPGGLMNKMQTPKPAPPKLAAPKIPAPKPSSSQPASSKLQGLLKQGQQQGKQIQGMQNKK